MDAVCGRGGLLRDGVLPFRLSSILSNRLPTEIDRKVLELDRVAVQLREGEAGG